MNIQEDIAERYNLDPDLLADALQHIGAGGFSSKWLDQLPADQYEAGHRVWSYLMHTDIVIDLSGGERDQLAQDTAEYIANTLNPRARELHVRPAYGKPAPTDIPTIKAALLEGTYWLSWADDRVLTAMRALHGPQAN